MCFRSQRSHKDIIRPFNLTASATQFNYHYDYIMCICNKFFVAYWCRSFLFLLLQRIFSRCLFSDFPRSFFLCLLFLRLICVVVWCLVLYLPIVMLSVIRLLDRTYNSRNYLHYKKKTT